jgi:hypothetical protein
VTGGEGVNTLKAAMQEGKKIEINLKRENLEQQELLSKHGNTHKIFTYTSTNTLQNENEESNKKKRKNIYKRSGKGSNTDKKKREQLGSCFSYTSAVITTDGRMS